MLLVVLTTQFFGCNIRVEVHGDPKTVDDAPEGFLFIETDSSCKTSLFQHANHPIFNLQLESGSD